MARRWRSCMGRGIGKSAIVGELARRATLGGFDVVMLDGRTADVAADSLQDALGEEPGRRLVVLDSLEVAPALGAWSAS